MKSNVKRPLYFSAYPLKAITDTSPNSGTNNQQSPYLRSILSGKTRTSSRVRIFPMVNPYKQGMNIRMVKRAKDVEASGDDWYNHYE